ncbi:uncharacterized protein [Montipora foliosa]|uniref:uncharacterized protein n=1 Tax=Montipora foliosa TaxID=591990 RepID=UPI0035F10D22
MIQVKNLRMQPQENNHPFITIIIIICVAIPVSIQLGFETIGCFKDTSNRAIQPLEGKGSILDGSYSVRKNAIAKCARAAMRKGYKLFAVQNGGWCAASATADQTFDKYGRSAACGSDGEGGPWANQVYVIKGFETIGCFKDTSNRAIQPLEGKDSILDGSYGARKNAIAKCAVAAMRKGYKMFAVQNGGWCAASATADQTFDKHGRSEACGSDGEGGPWANQVYVIKGFETIGCFKDTSNRAIQTLEGKDSILDGSYGARKNAIAKCAVAAMRKGYKMFAVQNGGWCAASATADQTFDKHGRSEACGSDGEGGPWANQVYVIKGFETIGCFKDTSNRAIQTLEGKDSILDGSYGARKNAIAKCAVAAMRKGYKMFAVQNGGWCAASATADQTFDKHGRSAACRSDGEGGPWANQVYVNKGFETIGCFKDTSNRAIQPLEGKDSILDGSYGARKNAIAKCAVAAMRKGYKMFAVQNGGWCAASATADQTFDKHGRSAACGSDGEGGPWANQVYVIKGFETIGCFKDTSNRAIQTLEGKDSILDGSYGARKNAIAKCAVAAMRKGYKMFAVQNGGWCAASATADQTFDKHGRSAACGSDGEGGPWANQVYVIKGFETIGCFKDTSNRAIQPLEGKDSILDGSYGARKNAIAKCAVAAMRKGYKMFAVQNGGWCAASATADQTFDKHGRSAACGSDGEGGPWANQVYVIKGFETIGCFKDTSNRAIQPLEGKDSILDGSYVARKNAIVKCAVAAMRKGYKMFAVQNGGWCAASATADQTFDKHGRSAACGSDGEGGPWANQVYVIKGFETIGCFKDTSNRAIQPLEGKDSILDGSYGARKNAIAKCAVAAMRKGYKMFAVQNGGWCAASATADQTFDKHGRSAACGSDGEGGPWANQVYVIKGFETIGCFKDTSNRAIQPLEGKDSILDGSYVARKNAIVKCAVAAMRKGYKMFAVQNGGWCAASATADQTFDKHGRSAACGSDGEGGPWANQVYVIKGFETIGCFKDTSNRAIQPLEGKDSILDGSYGARKNAIAKCAVAAMRKGYKMFAVQNGGWCAASATADQTFDKHGRSAACGSDGEGGPWANQVYVIKGFETIGCFKDTSNRAIQPLEGKDSILDGSYGARKNAIAKCAVAAMRKGYKMFAVQNGGWCAASATADQTFDKHGRSAACGSDGEGGPWANQVYVIKGFETIGCFKDTSNRAIQPLEGKDSILDGSYGARKNAIAKCAVAAMRKGYKMFAVQNGGWCAASATADQTFDKHGRSAACGSDGEGGPWANQVYVIKGFETIGCFKDTSNRAIQPLEGKDSILDGSYGARKNAIAKCAVAAMRKGYKMFAVQNGGWCAASATADQTFDKHGRSAACGSDGEGGPWANQVYVIKGFETIGCFKDTSNRAIQPLEGKDSILDGSYGARKNAIAKCAVAAMRKGYKMFAVQNGGWCAASATADQTFDKHGRSAACGSDGEGGPWANQVYVIKGFETIGCFKDTSNRAIQPLEGKDSILDGSYGARKNAIAKCAVAAMRKRYKMFAVQNGGWCAASATANQTFDKYGTSAACGSDGEGGPWANQVYVIKAKMYQPRSLN